MTSIGGFLSGRAADSKSEGLRPLEGRFPLPAPHALGTASSLHWREADLGYHIAKLLVLMQVLEFAVGDERGESKVVALAGDFEILQSVIIVTQGCVSVGHLKGRTGAVVEGFAARGQALLKQSAAAAAGISRFLQIDIFLRLDIVAQTRDCRAFREVSRIISLAKVNVLCHVAVWRNKLGLRGCDLHKQRSGFFCFSRCGENASFVGKDGSGRRIELPRALDLQ